MFPELMLDVDGALAFLKDANSEAAQEFNHQVFWSEVDPWLQTQGYYVNQMDSQGKSSGLAVPRDPYLEVEYPYAFYEDDPPPEFHPFRGSGGFLVRLFSQPRNEMR